MGLADRLANEMTEMKRGCLIGRLLETMPADDSAALQSAIDAVRERHQAGINPQARHGITATAIRRALAGEGHNMSDYTVQSHVYGRCGCGK
jgi:hypothetical protein